MLRRLVARFSCAALVLLCATPLAAQDPSWVLKSPANSPSARVLSGMVYDTTRGEVVLFGGYDGSNHNDTWVWDGVNWTQKSPANSPTPRQVLAMAYDAAHGQVVMFGGYTQGSGLFSDTWVWDGTNWAQKTPLSSPTPRAYGAMAYDADRGEVVLFGGNDSSALLNDTWVWDGTTWTQKRPVNSPTPRYQHAMAYDSAHGQMVLFGGNDGSSRGDTWVWDGVNWTQKSPANRPTSRVLHGMAYDVPLGEVVLFGGTDGTLLNDTWVWDGSNWTQKSPLNSPTPRYQHKMAYDELRGQAVLFGGYPGGGSSPLNDTWVRESGSPSSTGSISVATNLSSASFTITGPANYSGSGLLFSQSGAPAGTYTINYGAVSGYLTPVPAALVLTAGSTIVFSGGYVPLSGSISVSTNLPAASFTISGPAGFSGGGTSFSATGAPAGTYTITYGAVSGFTTPLSETQTLAAGGSLVFSATYAPGHPYTYTNGLGFGTDTNGNVWNIWSANGSNIWDWHHDYVGGYLHYAFKIYNYAGFYCSGSCRYHNVWDTNPTLGFETSNVIGNDTGVFPESNQNNHKYHVDIQWNATGYHATVYDITAGSEYSTADYAHPVDAHTHDSWTWGYSLWTGRAYADESASAHASNWTSTIYQDGVTGTTGGGGDVRTDALPVVLSPLPTITTQPSNQIVTVGANGAFAVAASGTPTPTLRWQVSTNSGTTWTNLNDGAPYAGSATATLTVASAPMSLTGLQYRAVANNSLGTATSAAATLTVTTQNPTIATHPANQTVKAGQSAHFTVVASGVPTPTYRWERLPAGSASWSSLANGGSYGGATTATLLVTGVTTSMSGDQFRAVATNVVGSATSLAATLTTLFYTYTYTSGLGFGTDANGNVWNIWSANGSNIWDWHQGYVGGYLHYAFKIYNYAGFYCSGSCRYHNVWDKNPTFGFETWDVLGNDSGIFPESNQNNHIYQVDVQWNATGYHAGVHDLTAGSEYSTGDYPYPVDSNTYDSWTWGSSFWAGHAYSDENASAHASNWTSTIYQDGVTGTSGGGGDVRTDALPVVLQTTTPTGTISVTTNVPGASFTITGPASYTGSGQSFTQSGAPVGTYTITYGAVSGHTTPSSQMLTLTANGSIAFTGTYQASPPPAGVQLTLLKEARENSRVVQASADAVDVDFQLRVTNSGTIVAHHVTVSDTLPSQLTFVSGDYFGGPASSCSVAAGPPQVAGESQVVCVIGTLGPGVSAEINLSLRVKGGTAVGPITNSASVFSDEADAAPSDNQAWATIGVIPADNPSIPVPLGTDGEPVDPYLVVNGEPNGTVATSRPTVVLTHGLQFAADFSPLWTELSKTLWTFDRDDKQGASALLPLEHCGQGPSATSPTCVNVVQAVWPAAFTVRDDLALDLPDRDEYTLAREHAFGAAVQVATLLRDRLGSASGYTGDRVQFIGHSLGTVVNAYAAALLLPFIKDVKTLQFTALDRPDHVGKLKASDTHNEPVADFAAQFGFHTNFFATALAAGRDGNTTTKIVVDNYYALNSAMDGYIAAGASDRLGVGAVASGSTNIPVYNHPALERPAKVESSVLKEGEEFNNDHSGVNQWYRWSMGPNSSAFVLPSWSLTPPPENATVPGDRFAPYCRGSVFLRPVDTTGTALDLSLSPCVGGWGYSILAGDGPPQAPGLVDTSLGKEVNVQVTFDLNNFRNIHGCTLSASYNIVCAEGSSAYAQVPIDLPDQTQYLQLRYRFVNPGDGDRVALFLDDLPLWSARGTDHSAGEWMAVPTPVRGLDGRHILTVALEGEGAVNAVFELGALTAIVGNGAPVVQAGPDQIVEATGPAGASVTVSPASLSDPDGDPLVAEWTGPFSTAQGASLSVVLPLGTHHIRLRASDPSGASNDDDVTITVRDSAPPSLSGLPAAFTVEATSIGGVAVAWPTPLAVDAVDPSPALTCAPASGSTFPLGQTPVTCTATDASGNTVSSGFTVTVRDTSPPALTLPASITREATGSTGAIVVFSTSAVDLVDGSVPVVCAQVSGALFGFGTTAVGCSAADVRGNRATGSFLVTVRDTIAPEITPPPDQTAVQTGPAGAVVSYPAPTVVERGSGLLSSSCTPASGATFAVGTTVVTCSAADLAGNSGSATFRVTVTPLVGGAPDGRMYGFGFVNNAAGRHHFAFRVAQVMDRDYGLFDYWVNDPRRCGSEDDGNARRRGDQNGDYWLNHCSPTNHFESISVSSAVFSNDPRFQPSSNRGPATDTVRLSGLGRWNGRLGYTFEVVASDQGEPGPGRDQFSLVVKDSRGVVVANVSGALNGGNIQSTRLLR